MTDAPGINVAATISRFSDSGHARCRRRLFVPITAFVDTSPHHDIFGDRSVVHSLASWKGGPHRRETHYALVSEDQVSARHADPAWHGFVEPISYGADYTR